MPMNQPQMLSSGGYIRAAALAPMLGIAVVTLWRWAANGKLPKPIKLSERVTAWQVKDIRQWMASKGEQAS